MVLNKYRPLAEPYLDGAAKRMVGLDPNILSWLAFLFAVMAGGLFVAAGEVSHHLLLLAFLAIFLNAAFDALDGHIARLTGKASRLGDFLDHVLDRYADAFIFGGIAVSAYCHTTVGLLAVMGVFFTSYMGTQGQAVGLNRNYGGVMGRADRLMLLFLFILLQWAFSAVADRASFTTLDLWGEPYPLTILEILMVIIAVGGNVTAVQRGAAAWRDMRRMESDGELAPPEGPQGLVVVETEGPADDEGGQEASEANGEPED